MTEHDLPSYDDSFDPADYLPLLAADLLEGVSRKKKEVFFREFKMLYHAIAHEMVRYAVEDHGSYIGGGRALINEKTNQPYLLSELGFDHESLAGDTAGSFIGRDQERVQHIPVIAVALWRAENK